MQPLLKDQAVLFAEKQFSEEVVELISGKIKELGGIIKTEREGSTILLVNPSHPSYKTEKEHADFLTKTYPHLPQPILTPYHWIANIYNLKKLVKPEDLSVVSPMFTHASTFENFRPLKAWVSVNVAREQDETPEQAQASLLDKLECAGAIGVNKRAQADLLVVDEQSQFATKVHMEKQKYNRHWQKIVERDWVDNCLKQKKMDWKLDNDNEDNESFLGDDVNHKEGKGPGRPTGGARVDYTPQDDDFLCRYLAAYHPAGSWASRKTYQNLVAAEARYPIASRHTAQSWHERFKKNGLIFERRVKGFIQAGVDASLKSRAEREKTKLAKTVSAEQIESTSSQSTPLLGEAGPSRTSGAIPEENEQGPARKRKLVELDDESSLNAENSGSGVIEKKSRQDAVASDGSTAKDQTQKALESATSQSPESVTNPQTQHSSQLERPIQGDTRDTTSNAPHNPPDDRTAAPQAQPVTEASTSRETVTGPTDLHEEESLTDLLPSASQLPPVQSVATAVDTAIDGRTPQEDAVRPAFKAETDNNTEEESQRGEATQAILADFAKAQAPAKSDEITPQNQTEPTHEKPRKSVRVDVEHSDVILPESAKNPNLTQQVASPRLNLPTQNTQSSPIHIVLSPPKRISQLQGYAGSTNEGNGSTRMSFPFQLEVNVRALPAGEPIPDIEQQKVIQDGSTMVTPQRQEIEGRNTPSSTSTNLPSGKPRLHDQIIRRRTLDKSRISLGGVGNSGRKRNRESINGPDMVFRETSIPPRPERITPSSSPAPMAIQTRAQSPPLNPRERMEKIAKGQSLIQKSVEEYKKRIKDLAEKYKMTNSQIIKFINDTGTKGSGEKYWEDVERSLKLKR
ncbi:uncharacterized protein I206_102443 [Kwoniella pini CBS 10737]|uniref:TERF2-interacting telomeric protein 1 Myb domain-containing protein n=1 Tax=Kwoniella pini CBS 10737 TaxID=1296096 RepID=A0A1B9I5G2_9TREE|nr:uncharacterized protein I206_02792 [Kwoniella pini CBS 10737]OCF50736.1 hypothetical protein I206_02792 [Kwoniella pini CBS 10737]